MKILSSFYKEVLTNAFLGKDDLLSRGKWEGSVTSDVCDWSVESIQESPAENIWYGSGTVPAGGKAVTLGHHHRCFLSSYTVVMYRK